MTTETPILNDHNKQEYPPMHTVEHILNQTMGRMFGCPRSKNTHIERKKSKCDYMLSTCPTPEQISAIEQQVNDVIAAAMPVTVAFVSHEEAAKLVDMSKLPADVSETIRLVFIGDYDVCACVGTHVENTNQITGRFAITTHDYTDGCWRVRFKLVE